MFTDTIEASGIRQQSQIAPHDYDFLVHANPEHQDWVVVNWCLANFCNFSCSYCPTDLHDGSVRWPDIDQVKSFCEKVVEHYDGKKIYFEFTGGEVTFWKQLPGLLKFLKSLGCDTGIISNGSKYKLFWEENIEHLDHVCLSFHPESADASYFLDIVQFCADKIRTHVNFMMHPQFFKECLDLAYKVKDVANISVAIQPLVEDFGDRLLPGYTEYQNPTVLTEVL